MSRGTVNAKTLAAKHSRPGDLVFLNVTSVNYANPKPNLIPKRNLSQSCQTMPNPKLISNLILKQIQEPLVRENSGGKPARGFGASLRVQLSNHVTSTARCLL